MDNPQHYQPLSYALHPPNPSTTPKPGPVAAAVPQSHHREDEEVNDGVNEDTGAEHGHINQADRTQGTASASKQAGMGDVPPQDHQFVQETDPAGKRRPGRPRGSKNKKIQDPPLGSVLSLPAPVTVTPPTGMGQGAAPPQLQEVSSQNQQYYEFQWRMLNLCAEFYGAAEELVKGTPPLVVAQCYGMGPGSTVDPLIMLSDAKRICDTLLSNPSQLIATPPPPLNPPIPTFYPSQAAASTSSAPPRLSTTSTPPALKPTPTPSSAAPPPPATVITNPGSFVVPLGTQPAYPYSYPPGNQYPPGGQYAGYYTPYPYAGYYPPPPPMTQPPAQAAAPVQGSSTSVIKPLPASNGSPWSDDEVDRVKKLAEESRSKSGSGEIDWDWVTKEWGPGRSRHQILLKATGLGLKESSSSAAAKGNPNKRRREPEDPSSPVSPAQPPNPAPGNANAKTSTSTPTNTATGSGSPAMSHTNTTSGTPAASPAMHSLQRPPSASQQQQTKPATMPWPMPTVAAANVSPALTPGTTQQGSGTSTSSYYRPRPPVSGTTPAPAHQFSAMAYSNSPSGS